MTFIRRLFAISAALLLTACSTPSPSLRLIGAAQLAGDLRVGDTRVGGLSGIDYDSVASEWLLVSDDRGVHGPTRFYRARIDYDAQEVSDVQITGMQTLVQAGGAPYARRGAPGQVADLEALRIDPLERSLWFAGEGDRAARSPMLLARAGMDGAPLAALPFPAALQIQPDVPAGGRTNAGPEGLSFSVDGQHLWLAMEGALIQDGQASAPGEGALTRLVLLDRQGRILAQYAYRLEPVQAPGRPGGYSETGIADILAIGPRRLLVIERAGRQMAHDFTFDVRLYDVDLQGATALDPDAPISAGVRPAVKRQLLGNAQLPAGWSDNYEAMTWGPRLANGHRSLVIVSDNNFTDGPSRFLVFDAGPDSAWR
ncbi:esterase-like activity of phytase family protein [Massilia sp. MP_M2]|uniref:esterase-like activity of phytase family protein n=1 Tax=Massilia sp. MP_M2 TaxID=3071713 RepID=UPI00319DF5D9